MLLKPTDLADWKREVLRSMRLPAPRERRAAQAADDAAGRRDFLAATLAAIGAAAGTGLMSVLPRSPLAGRVHAGEPEDEAVKTGTFFFPRLKFTVKDETLTFWWHLPLGDKMLRKNLARLTNINVSQEPIVVSLSEMDAMCRYPFVFMTSEGYFDLPKGEEANLKEFLSRGGFVHADDCVWKPGGMKLPPSDMPDGVFKIRLRNNSMEGDRFWYDYLKLLHRLFPEYPLRRIPLDHEIYNCYFEMTEGCPHFQGVEHGGWGLFEKGTGRIMSFASPGDLHCGWCCLWWGEERNMEAIKMGVNIIVYFLTH